jgi:N-acetylglucosaminyldiphosphoundecaprenol N-acetyl-beta-D-mannosaminyltransferase
MNTRHDLHSETGHKTKEGHFSILGVNILNVTKEKAVQLLENVLHNRCHRAKSVFFVNAHTLNIASGDLQYQAILNGGDFVFGDGTGVRWAAKLQGVKVLDNLQGTDFTPLLLQSVAERGFSYFLLGADETTVATAARYAENTFPAWRLSGFHHGYLNTPEMSMSVIEKINQSKPDLLLVGMGNPLQERWICHYQSQLQTSLCMGIGGLFDFWAGNVSRAPQWLRRLGHEWLWRLYQQPRHKMHRYLLGNPKFLVRVLCDHFSKRKNRR